MTPIIFDTDSAERIAAAVQTIENQGLYAVGKRTPRREFFQRDFWAEITGYASGTGPYVWKYAFEEMQRTASGWNTLANGRSGTTASGWALNSIEANNPPTNATGVFGNSVDHGYYYPYEGFECKPVRGNPVVRMYQDYSEDGRTCYYSFQYINADDGSCTGG